MHEIEIMDQIKTNLSDHGLDEEEYNIRRMESFEGDVVFRVRVNVEGEETAYTDIPTISGPTEIYAATKELESVSSS